MYAIICTPYGHFLPSQAFQNVASLALYADHYLVCSSNYKTGTKAIDTKELRTNYIGFKCGNSQC